MTPNEKGIPKIGAAQVRLLQRLTEACAVSGDESEVRRIVLDEIRPTVDEVRVDSLGNVLAIKRGPGEGHLRVLLAAHMDEVGFIITGDDNDGFFRFEKVGGIDTRVLPGKSVWVGKEHLPGVIGAKPIHLTTSEERRSSILLDALRIDLGSATVPRSSLAIGPPSPHPLPVWGPVCAPRRWTTVWVWLL